jgi:hypothetical protein
LVTVFVIAHLFAICWANQALNMRVRYYRAMSRLYAAASSIAGVRVVPKEWWMEADVVDSASDDNVNRINKKDFDKWRRQATRPGEGMAALAWTLVVLVGATIAIGTVRFWPGLSEAGEPESAGLDLSSTVIVLVLFATCLIWRPAFWLVDSRKLKQLWDSPGWIGHLKRPVRGSPRVQQNSTT